MSLAAELRAALTARPRALGTNLLRELGWALPALLILGWWGGLLRPALPASPANLPVLAVVLFFVPGLGEELLFRGLPIRRGRPSMTQLLASTAAFVLWHPLQAVTFGPPWADLFLQPAFLACVAVLGLASARLYAGTGSLWPSVGLHWAVVFAWKAFGGGPF